MPHYHKLIVCFLIVGTNAILSADDKMEMNSHSGDHPTPYRRYSKELQDLNPEHLQGLDEVAFARMTLDDPLLKLAYTKVFTQSLRNIGASPPEEFLYTEPTEAPALADMRKRGDTAIPMLLKLLEENQETGFETSLLGKIDLIGTISLHPFLEYARNLLTDRTQTMSASAAGSAAVLLSRHGSKEDAELLRRVMEERPYVADTVTRKLDSLRQRLTPPETKSRPDLKGRANTSEEKADRSSTGTPKPASTNSSEQSQSNGWIAWAVLGIVFICILGRTLTNRSSRQ